jgi:hypothetical protein
VKWSFDRAVTVGGFPTFQMKAGSLEKPEQFTALDDYTFKVDFPERQADHDGHGGAGAVGLQLRGGEEARHQGRPLALG